MKTDKLKLMQHTLAANSMTKMGNWDNKNLVLTKEIGFCADKGDTKLADLRSVSLTGSTHLTRLTWIGFGPTHMTQLKLTICQKP